MKNILFIETHLGYRGTTKQLKHYAHYNETLLGNKSFIVAPANSELSSLSMFQERFQDRVFLYPSTEALEAYVDANNIDVVYSIVYGNKQPVLACKAIQVVHVVFDGSTPYGDVYAGVSEYIGNRYNIPFVNHIITLPDIQDNYREHLGIPNDAKVFVRYGGHDSFDIPFVHEVVYSVASEQPNTYFLFINTDPFCRALPNIIHLSPTTDEEVLRAFLNTGDAFLHARERGETFGLSVAEACYANIPMITYINSPETNHINVLKDKGLYYSNASELYTILKTFVKPSYNYTKLVDCFSPEKVMQDFQKIFLAD